VRGIYLLMTLVERLAIVSLILGVVVVLWLLGGLIGLWGWVVSQFDCGGPYLGALPPLSKVAK
jgi:hypothetical protein